MWTIEINTWNEKKKDFIRRKKTYSRFAYFQPARGMQVTTIVVLPVLKQLCVWMDALA